MNKKGNHKFRTRDLIVGVRDLTRDDLALLDKPRDQPLVTRLRDPHHRLARLIASGLRQGEAAHLAGYSQDRACILMKDPTFTNLVESYRNMASESFVKAQDEFHEMAVSNMLKAERHIAERIEQKEEEGELLSVREALAISRDAADRFGYGKKTTNVNVNVDFAARLERASRRSVEVRALPVPSSSAATEPAPRGTSLSLGALRR